MKWKQPKVKVVLSVLLVAMVATACAIGVLINDIWKIKGELDNLYLASQKSHSGMARIMIELSESELHQKQTVLTVLVVLMAVLVAMRMTIKHKHTGDVTDTRTLRCLACIFLVFVFITPIVPIVNAEEKVRYWANVEMNEISDLYQVYGFITPRIAGAVRGFVAHHICVGFPSTKEWIGGGHFDEVGIGTFYYIEWYIDGVYHEVRGPSVAHPYKEYRVLVYDDISGGEGWGTLIWDSDLNLILGKGNVDLPHGWDAETWAIAGGESTDTANRMRAHFSDLKWRTYDPEGYPNQYDEGDWDGFDFPTSLYLDAPYYININEPYCKFDVLGGTGKILAIYVCTHGGTTKPAPGPYAHDYGSSVTVTANAEPDWRFLSWVLDGTVKYANPITLTMNSDHTLKTYFCGSGGGGEICPTLFVWNGSDYNDLGVIDIHADEDVVREVPVATELVSIDNHKATFRLREGWEGLTYSHSQIDRVKLHAVDSDGNQLLCPLVEATHSEFGNVLPRLLLSDDRKCDVYLLETIDLEFVVPWQTDEFVFVIEGCNTLKY